MATLLSSLQASSSRAPEREKEQASYRCKHKKGKSSSSELERLRKERRKREEAERARAEALMRSHYCGESSAGTRSVPAAVDETPGRLVVGVEPCGMYLSGAFP